MLKPGINALESKLRHAHNQRKRHDRCGQDRAFPSEQDRRRQAQPHVAKQPEESIAHGDSGQNEWQLH